MSLTNNRVVKAILGMLFDSLFMFELTRKRVYTFLEYKLQEIEGILLSKSDNQRKRKRLKIHYLRVLYYKRLLGNTDYNDVEVMKKISFYILTISTKYPEILDCTEKEKK